MRTILLCLFVLSIMLLANQATARTLYVTDSLEITLRSGPDATRKSVKMLPSGTPLQILDQTTSWYRVRADDGQTGWVLKRYIMQEVPKKMLISNLRDRIKTLEESYSKAQSRIQNLQSENTQLSSTLK